MILPKIYNGKNKTFFFTNLDWFKFRSGPLPGFGNTTPDRCFQARRFQRPADQHAGRHGRLGKAGPLRTDFQSGDDPAGERRSRPRSVSRQYHPCQRSAAQSGSRQTDAADGAALEERPLDQRRRQSQRRPDLDRRFPDDRVPRGSPYSPTSSRSPPASIGPRVRRSATAAKCSDAQPHSIRRRTPITSATASSSASATHHATQQFDYIISNSMLWHTTAAWDRWVMSGQSALRGSGLARPALGHRQERHHR